MENFKIRIKNEHESYFIQKTMHKKGIQWFGRKDKNHFMENLKHISVMKRTTGTFMHYSINEFAFLNISDSIHGKSVREITFEEFFENYS